MEFKQVEIDEGIEGILEIAKLSFEKFYPKEKIYNQLKDKKYWIFVAIEKGKIIGFKIWYEEKSHIYSWLGAVHPDYRRKGVATELMKIQFRISKENGYKQIIVKTHIGHPEMIEFLEKEGFTKFKTDKNHWNNGRDALFFKKIIL